MVRKLLMMSVAAACTAFYAGTAAADGDAAAGQKIFQRCAVCHGIGDMKKPMCPNLNGVVGRTAGTQAEFLPKYSKAMKDAGAGGLVWTEANINEYLTDPKKKVPGNKMAFAGLKKDQERADVIAYIKTFSPPAK